MAVLVSPQSMNAAGSDEHDKPGVEGDCRAAAATAGLVAVSRFRVGCLFDCCARCVVLRGIRTCAERRRKGDCEPTPIRGAQCHNETGWSFRHVNGTDAALVQELLERRDSESNVTACSSVGLSCRADDSPDHRAGCCVKAQ